MLKAWPYQKNCDTERRVGHPPLAKTLCVWQHWQYLMVIGVSPSEPEWAPYQPGLQGSLILIVWMLLQWTAIIFLFIWCNFWSCRYLMLLPTSIIIQYWITNVFLHVFWNLTTGNSRNDQQLWATNYTQYAWWECRCFEFQSVCITNTKHSIILQSFCLLSYIFINLCLCQRSVVIWEGLK